jgi:WD40 repeat protein
VFALTAVLHVAGDNGIRVFECNASGSWALTAEAGAAHEQDVNHVAWQPGSATCLASCSDDGTIKMWRYTPSGDAASAAAMHEHLPEHTSAVDSAAGKVEGAAPMQA